MLHFNSKKWFKYVQHIMEVVDTATETKLFKKLDEISAELKSLREVVEDTHLSEEDIRLVRQAERDYSEGKTERL